MNTFGDSPMKYDIEITIDVNIVDCIRASILTPNKIGFCTFFRNFVDPEPSHATMLHLGMRQLNMMFAFACNCLPIRN